MEAQILQSLAQYEQIRALLRSEFPDADDEALLDTLDGLCELPEMVAAIVRSCLEDVALAAALRSRVSDMQERLGRLEGRAEKKRALIASVMERADMRKLTEPDFTVSMRSTPCPLVVTAEANIPGAFWKPQLPKLDRKALLNALHRGECVPGASLGNGGITIAVRTR